MIALLLKLPWLLSAGIEPWSPVGYAERTPLHR